MEASLWQRSWTDHFKFFGGVLLIHQALADMTLATWLLQYKLGIYNVLYERRGRYSAIDMEENKPQKQLTIGASCNFWG